MYSHVVDHDYRIDCRAKRMLHYYTSELRALHQISVPLLLNYEYYYCTSTYICIRQTAAAVSTRSYGCGGWSRLLRDLTVWVGLRERYLHGNGSESQFRWNPAGFSRRNFPRTALIFIFSLWKLYYNAHLRVIYRLVCQCGWSKIWSDWCMPFYYEWVMPWTLSEAKFNHNITLYVCT